MIHICKIMLDFCIVFNWCLVLRYIIPNILADHEMTAHITSPVTVGMTIAAAVHFHEPVSFFMVRHDVEHGKWQSMNTITHSAVTHVQPFRPRISASIAVSPASVSVL